VRDGTENDAAPAVEGTLSSGPVASITETDPSEAKSITEQIASTSIAESIPEQNGSVSTDDKKASATQSGDKTDADAIAQPADKQGRGNVTSPRSQETHDSRKSKKGKKGKATDKESEADQEKKEEPQPKIELSEAPIPSVNIWQQRLGEQATKVKTAAPSRPASSMQGQSDSTSTKPKTTNSETEGSASSIRHASNGNRQHRKGSDLPRSNDDGHSRRGAPRGARVNERDEKMTLPAISNAASWPTPDTAASTEIKTSTSSEKDEKDDGNVSKTEKKKWIAVPFVPTAKFNTPIPGRGAPRTGGRGGSRASRDGPTRGAAGSVSSGTNGRPHEAGSGSRPPSETAGASSADASTAQEGSKITATGPSESTKAPGEATSRPETAKASHNATDSAAAERSHAARTEGAHKSAENARDHTSGHNREGHQGPNGAAHRSSDRPRGGRGGRGGHGANGATHQNSASYGHGSNGYQFHSSSRQASQQGGSAYSQMPYSANYSAPSGTNHRGRPNSVSLGRSQPNANGRHNNPRLPPIQPPQAMSYDAQMYPQTAIPYDYFSANVLALVQTQVEYYFSVDNLCKDYFLRRNMDSQGYVFLSVIANFKRMKEMTTDYDMIRAACEESREVDLVYGEDGADRVRRMSGWESWVLQDISGREYSARTRAPRLCIDTIDPSILSTNLR